MSGDDRITAGGHVRVRPFNTRDTYPEQQLGNDLAQAVIAGRTIYLRGQVAQDLDTRENVAVGDPGGQAAKVMANVELLLSECGAALEHIVSCDVYLTDIRHREAVYRVLGEHLQGVYRKVGVRSQAELVEWLHAMSDSRAGSEPAFRCCT